MHCCAKLDFVTSVDSNWVQTICRDSEGRLSIGHLNGFVGNGPQHFKWTAMIGDVQQYQTRSDLCTTNRVDH